MAPPPHLRPLYYHRIFDLVVTSDIPLPELPAAEPAQTDLRVEFTESPIPATPDWNWVYHWRDPDGEITLSLAKPGRGCILRAPDVADFHISSDCARVQVMAAPLTPLDSVRHQLLDQVLPRLVAQRGRPVLHASAVSIDGWAVAFLGESGAGKSTIATWFGQQGHDLLTDDCLALQAGSNPALVVPAYAGARLWDDSPALSRIATTDRYPVAPDSGKFRLRTSSANAPKTAALAALMVLAPGNRVDSKAVKIAPLSGVAAVMALQRHSFQLDLADSKCNAAQLQVLGNLVNQGLPIFQLSYPHRSGALARVQALVVSLVRSLTHGACPPV